MSFLQIQQLTQPITEPITLDQAHQQLVLNSTFTDDDALITALITAARQYAEKYTRRAFFTQQWQLTLDHFPAYIYSGTINPALRRDWNYYAGIWNGVTIALPKPKCISVDSITYIDLTGTQQTLDPSTYVVDLNSTPARIVPAPGLYWPLNTLYIPGSVAVTFTCGSYTQQFTESFTVPAASPYVYTPLQPPLTGVLSVTDGDGNAIMYSLTNGALTFQAASAGQTYTVSYYAGTTFPAAIGQAMLLLISHWYQNRDSASAMTLKEIPFGVTALLDMYKVTVLDYEAMV
jgi:hypothetical protein